MKSPTFILLCCPSLMLQFVGRDVSGTFLDFVFIWIILSAQWCNKSDRHSWYSSHPHWVVSCEWFTSTRIEVHPWIIIGFEHHAVVYKNIEMSYFAYFCDTLLISWFRYFSEGEENCKSIFPLLQKFEERTSTVATARLIAGDSKEARARCFRNWGLGLLRMLKFWVLHGNRW